MNFTSIWVPLFPGVDARARKGLVRNALVLGEWLGASVELVVPALEAGKNAQPQAGPRALWVHGVGGDVGSETLRAMEGELEAGRAPLLLLETDRRGPLGVAQGLSEPKERLLQSCAAPIWILPARFALSRFPVRSIVVPMSGECSGSEALERAIEMGNRHGVPVDIVHVTSASSRRPGDETGRSALGYASDEFQHEYPAMVEELIVQASPFASPRDRLIIRDFNHRYGEVTRELKRHIRSGREDLLVFEWKGSLRRGHADCIKLMLRQARGSLLLVRERQQGQSWLRAVERREGAG